ncbi:MAG: hypothetical protein KJO26_16210, partial [Deltaproteobacteria bacterium]|nr:hypothetical protein [Deltaproteobacteria bacterium]
LWGQRGSRVIRGNLLAIPVGESFIYVEPIYLEAKQEEAQATPAAQGQGGRKQQTRQPVRQEAARTAALPELKRVIVAIGNRVSMEEKLELALNQVLEAVVSHKKEVSPIPGTDQKSGLGAQALKYYNNAKDYLQKGDWAGYGRELEKLESILKQLSKTGKDKKI